MTTMDFRRRWPHLLAAIGLSLLAACGGGGSSGGMPGTGATDAPPAALALAAIGSSARTTSLAWTPVPGASGYTLERRTTGSTWTTIATLDAADDRYVDDGLAQETTYTYRLAARGTAATPAEQSATTSADTPLVTAAAVSLGGTPEAGDVDAAGGSVEAADGSVRVTLPAGAVAARTTVSLRRTTNPVPDGQGEGVRVHIDTLPAMPLTLTLRYDAALDADADGLGIALQRVDGSWLTLPVTAIDKAQRTLSTTIAPSMAARETAGGLAHPASARAAAASVGLEFSVVKYLNFHLAPRESVVETGGTQLLVPYARTLVAIGHICLPDEEFGCIPMPLLDKREIPFENQKAGYTRQWFVFAEEGGAPALGTITPRATSGAIYQAPAQEPTPNPVIVTFRSKHLKSGRTLTLSASIRVREPVWTMTLHGVLDQSADIGFAFSAEAVWTRVPGSETTYQATGTQSVHVINITCTGSASPATVALPPGALTMDRSVEPARYTLDVGSLWNTVITGTCPGHGTASVGMTVPGRLVVEGTVGGNGTRIEGTTSQNHITWDWALTSQL